MILFLGKLRMVLPVLWKFQWDPVDADDELVESDVPQQKPQRTVLTKVIRTEVHMVLALSLFNARTT